MMPGTPTASNTTAGRALSNGDPSAGSTVDVAPIVGTRSCQVEHVGLVLSGRAAVRMDDGEERVLLPGDVFYVPPGHDSWVVGDEPYVSLHLQGAVGTFFTLGATYKF